MVTTVTKKPQTVAQAIREAVAKAVDRGESINSIANASGVPQPVLQRWWSGVRADITLSTAERLCRHFGIRVR